MQMSQANCPEKFVIKFFAFFSLDCPVDRKKEKQIVELFAGVDNSVGGDISVDHFVIEKRFLQ